MDSLTHALFMAVLCSLAGRPELLPFAVLGAVIPDVDVTFQPFSDRDPRLYIFTHGGFTHSLAGATILAVAAGVPAIVISGGISGSLTLTGTALALAVVVAGALSHAILDFLAYPGIPLLYPATDKKYTLGIAAGPSMALAIASLVYLALLVAGATGPGSPRAYLGFFILAIAAALGLKLYVSVKAGGMTIPGLNPLKWLVVTETPGSYLVYAHDLLRGRSGGVIYEKFDGVSPSEAMGHASDPEVKRMKYHSYIVTAKRDGGTITYADPLRENGHLWYPPYYKSLTMPDKSR